MKMGAMRKHYPALTGAERFRMAMGAKARGDAADLALLRTTCPMRAYTATDYEFQGRWEQSARAVRLFALLWLPALVRLREAEVALVRARTAHGYFTEGYIMGANAAWEEAGNTEPYLTREDFERR